MRKALRIACVIVGTICVLAAAGSLARMAGYEKTKGTIELSRSVDGGIEHFVPSITYTRPDGARCGFNPPPGSLPSSYKSGDSVTVLYDPAHMKVATVHSFVTVWRFPVLAIGSAVLLFTLTLLVLRQPSDSTRIESTQTQTYAA